MSKAFTGSVYAFVQIDATTFQQLAKLTHAMKNSQHALLPTDVAMYRSMVEQEANVIDGDLVSLFLDMDPVKQSQLVSPTAVKSMLTLLEEVNHRINS